MTNTPTDAQAVQQVDAAAHYLSDLFHQTGSWDKALHDYSGGGYGLAQVQAKGNNPPKGSGGGIDIPGTVSGAAGAVGNAASSVAGTVADTATAVSRIADLITSGSFWLRVAEIIGGAIVLALGLLALTGKDTAAVAATAAKVVR